MSVLAECHKKLGPDGHGYCSKPMWRGGMDAGFCNEPAYGEVTPESLRRYRLDGISPAPALACPGHGGPSKPEPREEP